MENGEKPTMARASTYQPLLLLPRKHPRTFRGVNQERLNEFMKLYLSKGEFHVFTVVVSRFRYSHVALLRPRLLQSCLYLECEGMD